MAILTPPPAAPQRGDRTTFASRVDAFITWLINFVSELVSLVANLNSIAAGGAYAIPFRFTTDTGHITQGSWLCLLSPTSITFDAVDARYADTTAQLSNLLSASTSTVKAQLRICAQADPSRWFLYNVVGYTQYGAYGGATVQIVASSGTFAEGESVIAFFQRTGDKGDKGDAADLALPTIHVRDEKPMGTDGGQVSGGSYIVRTLNTVRRNTIPGASLSANRVTVPAGTYNIFARAPGVNCKGHRLTLWNVTDNVLFEYGTSAYAGNNADPQSNMSIVEIHNVQIGGPRTFELRHHAAFTPTYAGAGVPSGGIGAEVYAELIFEKVT